MTNEEFIILAGKIADGTANLNEIALYDACYNSFQQDQQSWEEIKLDSVLLKQESLQVFWKEVGGATSIASPAQTQIPVLTSKLWPKIAIAAAVAAIMFGVWFFATPPHGRFISTSSSYANDINPGKSSAVLTLANGKNINLSDAKTGVVIGASRLTYNDGTDLGGHHSDLGEAAKQISNKGKASMLTATTPRGGTYQVTLPDGTHVWLNAASQLRFPSNFTNSDRRNIQLIGEAYFEVAKDKKHPFVVKTARETIEVLGTHFNVSSYPNERNSRTSLLEGAVKINTATILKPGQQAVIEQGILKVIAFDAEEAIAWKNGTFVFNGQDLESIMNQVARWYDVEVVYQEDGLRKQTFDGTVSRFQKISQLLEVLETTGSVHFKLTGRRLLVMK